MPFGAPLHRTRPLLLAAAIAFAAAPAFGQSLSLRVSANVLRPPTLVTPVEPHEVWSTGSAMPAAPVSAAPHWLGSSFDLERPRDLGAGVYTKPKIVVGVPSMQMRGWMRAAGVDAERCMLPMLRARTSTQGGDLNGSFWLYARCTFH